VSPEQAAKAERARARFARGEISSQAYLQAKAVAEGKCMTCGKPRVTAFYCRSCADKANARKRDLYAFHHGPVVAGRRRCGVCQSLGHDRRNCPEVDLGAAVMKGAAS
jgi:hypothetical protein